MGHISHCKRHESRKTFVAFVQTGNRQVWDVVHSITKQTSPDFAGRGATDSKALGGFPAGFGGDASGASSIDDTLLDPSRSETAEVSPGSGFHNLANSTTYRTSGGHNPGSAIRPGLPDASGVRGRDLSWGREPLIRSSRGPNSKHTCPPKSTTGGAFRHPSMFGRNPSPEGVQLIVSLAKISQKLSHGTSPGLQPPRLQSARLQAAARLQGC